MLSEPNASVRRVGPVTKAGATVMFGRVYGVLEPSRTIGDPDVKRMGPAGAVSATPSSSVTQLGSGGSMLLLASDGLFDVLTGPEAMEIAMKAGRSGGCPCAAVTSAARQLGSTDDIGAVCVVMG